MPLTTTKANFLNRYKYIQKELLKKEVVYLEDFLPWNPEVQAFCKIAEE